MWPFRRRTSEIDTDVVVLQTGNTGNLALVRSILDNAGIKYYIRNDYVEDLFGLGRLGGSNVMVGPVKIIVDRADVETVSELIGDMQESKMQFPAKAIIIGLYLIQPIIAGIIYLLINR